VTNAVPNAGSHVPTRAERAIRRRIARQGRITFAEYMARALYGPGGYYAEGGREAGRNFPGDYYTSPQVHPAFGALISVQLFHFWTLLGQPNSFVVVEPGAGNGLLCRDILTAAAHLPDGFGEAIRYVACDLRPLAGWEHGTSIAQRIVGDALRLPVRNAVGCVLSNELLDAFPVHRVRMERNILRELYVDVGPDVADGYEGVLFERADIPSTPRLEQYLTDAGISLAEGQTAEVCLMLEDWSKSVAAVLEAGFVLTIDYGRSAADLYNPEQRPDGTLVTYRNHLQTDSPLVDAGRQDMTAQVDFTSLQWSGERAGLTSIGSLSQGQFLHRLGLQTMRRSGPPDGLEASGWNSLQVGPDGLFPDVLPDTVGLEADGGRAWLTGLTHLTRPGGLGDFRALLQSKGVAAGRADQALSWLDDSSEMGGYSPAQLAAMIPSEAMRLDEARLPLFG
jgi:SAM-dependent MidA family methyltransferase